MKKIIPFLLLMAIIACSPQDELEDSINIDNVNAKNLTNSSNVSITKDDHERYLNDNSALIYQFIKKYPQHVPYLQSLVHPIKKTIPMSVLYDESRNSNFTHAFKSYYLDWYTSCWSQFAGPVITRNPPPPPPPTPPFGVIPPKNGLNDLPINFRQLTGDLVYNHYKSFNELNNTEIFLPNGIDYAGTQDIIHLGHPLSDVDAAYATQTYVNPVSGWNAVSNPIGWTFERCYGQSTLISRNNVNNGDYIILSRPIKDSGQIPLHSYINFDIEAFLGNTSHGSHNTNF